MGLVKSLTALGILVLLAVCLFVLGIRDAGASTANADITHNEASTSANDGSSASPSVTITITMTPVCLPDEQSS
jgi:hypothetical protein